MQTLYEYLFESTFKTEDFYKYGYKYSSALIEKILSFGKFTIGDKEDKKDFVIPDDIYPSVKAELEELLQKGDMELKDFDEIMKRHNLPVWRQIFKGDFSGYVNGLASKNKGNEFEDVYITNFIEHAPQLEKALGLQPYTFENCVPVGVGGKNQPRPLTAKGKSIIAGGSHATVGESVVDVFVKDKDGNSYNLSLKYGTTVTFFNAGVKRLFTDRSFKEYEIKGKYTAETANGVDGNHLLEILGIDGDKFADVFTDYGKGVKKDSIDVTKEIKNSNELMDLIESVVGYNYVLVHQIGSKVHYVDLRTEKDMKKLIGKIKSAEVYYGGKDGKGKRVDVIIEMTNMTIDFNIRNKQGGLYPTHIMADYTIRH